MDPPVRSVIITGGTAGLGYATALHIARAHPDYRVFISSRTNPYNAAEAINKALGQDNTVYLPLDLSDLANVRAYVERWLSQDPPPLVALVLNAGIQFPGDLQLSRDGMEMTFAVCHAGHALLFHLLCARVLVVSSGTHDPSQRTGVPDAVYNSAEELAHPAPRDKRPGRQRYSSAKLANVLWMYALHRRLGQRVPDRAIAVNAFDPGLMPGTGLARAAGRIERFLWNRVLPRSLPLLRAVFSPNIHTTDKSGAALARLVVGDDFEGISGKYFIPPFEGAKDDAPHEMDSSRDSHVEAKQDDLWAWTVKSLAANEREQAAFEGLT